MNFRFRMMLAGKSMGLVDMRNNTLAERMGFRVAGIKIAQQANRIAGKRRNDVLPRRRQGVPPQHLGSGNQGG